MIKAVSDTFGGEGRNPQTLERLFAADIVVYVAEYALSLSPCVGCTDNLINLFAVHQLVKPSENGLYILNRDKLKRGNNRQIRNTPLVVFFVILLRLFQAD